MNLVEFADFNDTRKLHILPSESYTTGKCRETDLCDQSQCSREQLLP